MSTQKKSTQLIDKIIAAKNKIEAIEILNDTLEVLHLSKRYTEMVAITDEIQTFTKELNLIDNKINDSIKTHEELNEIRHELDRLYIKVNDSLTHKVSVAKIYYDEIKSTRRYEALSNLKDSDTAKNFKAKSTSALETIIGGDDNYAQLASEKAISYGNYKQLEGLMKGIERLGNTVASREKRELIILGKDTK